MDQNPLVTEQIDAGKEFLGKFGEKIPILSAFWLKVGEGGSWYLYVASTEVGDKKLATVYGEVNKIAMPMRSPYFDPFQVKLITEDDALARAALEMHQWFPGNHPIRLKDRYFGGVSAEEIYLYPVPTAVA